MDKILMNDRPGAQSIYPDFHVVRLRTFAAQLPLRTTPYRSVALRPK